MPSSTRWKSTLSNISVICSFLHFYFHLIHRCPPLALILPRLPSWPEKHTVASMKPPMDVSKPESDFNVEKIFRAVLVNIIIISASAYLNWTFFQWTLKYIDSCFKLTTHPVPRLTCDTSVNGCHVPPIFICVILSNLMWNVLSNISVLFKTFGINCAVSATGLCCAQCRLPWII